MNDMRELINLMEAKHKGGYVMDNIIEADKSIGAATGGLSYRNNKDGSIDLSSSDSKKISQAMKNLEDARKLVNQARKLISNIDLQYTGKE